MYRYQIKKKWRSQTTKKQNYDQKVRTPQVNKLFGRFTLKDISFMNFDVPITTFAISVVCLGPPEMTEIKKTVMPLQPQQWRRHVSITSVARTSTVDQYHHLVFCKKNKKIFMSVSPWDYYFCNRLSLASRILSVISRRMQALPWPNMNKRTSIDILLRVLKRKVI